MRIHSTIEWLKFRQFFYSICQKTSFSFLLLLSSFWIVLGKVKLCAALQLYGTLLWPFVPIVGEFGIVYRAHLNSYEGHCEPGLVAVKTLKGIIIHLKEVDSMSRVAAVGIYTLNDFNSLVEECTKMAHFNHRNVLSLIGVGIDAGEAPYLIMPYMEMGSLLSYLRKERAQLTIVEVLEMSW